MQDFLLKQPAFKLNTKSVFVFIAAALVAWGLHAAAQITFPSQNTVPYLIRTGIALILNLALIQLSFRLLNMNGLPASILSLALSKRSAVQFLTGVFIGILAFALFAGLLYLFVPYHFARGRLSITSLVMECFSYLVGSSLEELTFRGFLLVILTQQFGWRMAILAMALPFGLFHLPGLGLTLPGLKMVATTASYSFVFSLSFVLTRSLWTAIGVHVFSNILLHSLLGLDGMNTAVFVPVMEDSLPKHFDSGFLIFILGSILTAAILYLIVLRSRKQAQPDMA
jgi:membrane protease YdiL (CAAX protease family)